ncbi:MAG: response regulator [Ignavibacteria bacterium]|nr:response regulator [Ignavibacteria bacterium]
MNYDLRPAEILLVEDNIGDVRLIEEALKDTKLLNNLHNVSDGVFAMDFLRKQNGFENAPTPDLIILDLNMPRKNGFEVLEEVKKDEKLKKIPIVVMTVSNDEQDILKSYNLHANCYVTKPLDFSQFCEIVRRIENFWFSIVTLPKREE